uniref:Uncharacterized protein n=1 Tax=Fagus sylvatica TaxID=28930 RepID=A0A2N9GMI5_FAGSY
MSGTVPPAKTRALSPPLTTAMVGWLNGSSLPTPTKVILDFKTQLPL